MSRLESGWACARLIEIAVISALGLLDRDARPEPRHLQEIAPQTRAIFLRVDGERNPQVEIAAWIGEPRRHDADDLVCLSIQLHRPPDDRAIPAEPACPQAIAQDDDELFADLRSGDVLVAFTDGVTEALNAREEEFGEERLKALLREVLHLQAPEISARIADALRGWIMDTAQYDDLTFIVLKVT